MLMLKRLQKANRRRVPVRYAVAAAIIAALSVAAVEMGGKALNDSYTGLGGKLGGAPSATLPVAAPVK
jgi:Flp pilus assembly pilin Flp